MARNMKNNKNHGIFKQNENVFSLNEYLSQYSKNHVTDDIIKKWYQTKEVMNVKKTKTEWESVIHAFFSETEK